MNILLVKFINQFFALRSSCFSLAVLLCCLVSNILYDNETRFNQNTRESFCPSVERLNLDFAIDFQFFELHLFDSRVYPKQFLFPLVFLYSYSNLQLFEISVIRSKFPFPLELRITGAHY